MPPRLPLPGSKAWSCAQDAGLRELARKRTLRLVRRAVQRWTEKMQEARRVREEEQRLLSALKRVNVGVRARLWAPLRSSPAAETSSVQPSCMHGLLTPWVHISSAYFI